MVTKERSVKSSVSAIAIQVTGGRSFRWRFDGDIIKQTFYLNMKTFFLLFLLGLGGFARAQSVLDQSFTGPSNGGEFINEGFSPVAQVFTAGLSGTLAGVNVDIQSQSPYSLQVSIHNINGGAPAAPALGETSLEPGPVTLNDLIVFPQSISVVAGDQYAIEVDYLAAPPPGPGHGQGVWAGAFDTDEYPAGFEIAFNGANWVRDSPGDLLFQTYVQTVPEPGARVWLAAGTGLLLFRWWWPKATVGFTR